MAHDTSHSYDTTVELEIQVDYRWCPAEPDVGIDERYIEIRAASVVVATGCIERPLLFGDRYAIA